jgi:hypothetical protein
MNNKIPTNPLQDEDAKDHIYEGSDEEEVDQKKPWGHAPEDVADIEEMLDDVGIQGDDDGPHELNVQDVIDKNQHNS